MDSMEAVADESPRVCGRQERLEGLALLIGEGSYFVPAIEIANAILFGRPKWGNTVPEPGRPRSAVH